MPATEKSSEVKRELGKIADLRAKIDSATSVQNIKNLLYTLDDRFHELYQHAMYQPIIANKIEKAFEDGLLYVFSLKARSVEATDQQYYHAIVQQICLSLNAMKKSLRSFEPLQYTSTKRTSRMTGNHKRKIFSIDRYRDKQ